VAKYAESVTRNEKSVHNEIWAYEVYAESALGGRIEGYFKHLVAIHAAPRTHWPVLAKQMVEREWTVEETEATSARTPAE
jgi:hypothetical protein